MTLKNLTDIVKKYSRDNDLRSDHAGSEITYSAEIGGMDGGSCWGTEATEFSRPEGYKECEDYINDRLEKILLEVAPNITFLQYRSLSRIILTSSYSNYEYYGNRSNYLQMRFTTEDLFNKLRELGLV